jgi:zinc protease
MIRSFAPRLVCSVAALSLLWSGAEARPVPVKGTKPAVAAASVQPARPWLYQNSDVPIDTAWLFGTLPNGLRYAIRRNGVPPGQVSIRMRVDAGSLYERPQESGYAHFIEHLTFRGSKFVPDGESKRLWQRLGVSFGSDSNAQTTPTATTYALDLPNATPDSIGESLKILSGMASDPNIVPSAVEAERAIVLAEMRESAGAASRVEDASRALFFAGQPLGSHAPIGTTQSLTAATDDSLRAFHDRWYRPENVVISISGDADPKALEALIVRHFADWKAEGPAASAPDFGKPDPRARSSAVVVQPAAPVTLSLVWLRPWQAKADTIVYNQRKLADTVAIQMINRRLEEAARRPAPPFYRRGSRRTMSAAPPTALSSASCRPTRGGNRRWARCARSSRTPRRRPRARPRSTANISAFETNLAVDVENQDTEASATQAGNIVSAVDIRETTVTAQAALDIYRAARGIMTPDYMLDATRRMFSGDAMRAMLVLPLADMGAEARLAAAHSAPVERRAGRARSTSTVTMDDLPALPPQGKVVSRAPVGRAGHGIHHLCSNGVRMTLFANNGESGKVRVNVRFGHGLRDLSPKQAQPIMGG